MRGDKLARPVEASLVLLESADNPVGDTARYRLTDLPVAIVLFHEALQGDTEEAPEHKQPPAAVDEKIREQHDTILG